MPFVLPESTIRGCNQPLHLSGYGLHWRRRQPCAALRLYAEASWGEGRGTLPRQRQREGAVRRAGSAQRAEPAEAAGRERVAGGGGGGRARGKQGILASPPAEATAAAAAGAATTSSGGTPRPAGSRGVEGGVGRLLRRQPQARGAGAVGGELRNCFGSSGCDRRSCGGAVVPLAAAAGMFGTEATRPHALHQARRQRRRPAGAAATRGGRRRVRPWERRRRAGGGRVGWWGGTQSFPQPWRGVGGSAWGGGGCRHQAAGAGGGAAVRGSSGGHRLARRPAGGVRLPLRGGLCM